MSKREIFVLLILIGGMAWALRSPLGAACLFSWNNIFRPLRWAKASGVFNPEVLPTHHAISGLLGFSALMHYSRMRWNLGSTLLSILLLRVWIGVPFAAHTDIALEAAIALSKYFIPLILIGCLLTDRKSQQIYLYVLALSVGFHLAWAGFHGLVLRGGVEDQMGIPGGQMTGRNDFTVAATGCLPLMAFMAFYYDGPWKQPVRWIVRIMLGFGSIAFFYSGSRGAILGLACLFAWWAVMTGRPAKRVSIALVLGIVALPLVPAFVWERMSTIEWSGEQTEGSAAERLEVMKLGWKMTVDNPVMGVGPENSWRVSSDLGYRPDRPGVGIETHFIWLKCSSEYGFPVLVFFVWVIVTTLIKLRRRARAAKAIGDRSSEEMATALSCAIVGFLATGTFTSKFLSEYLWSFFMLSYAFLATPLGAGAGAGAGAASASDVSVGPRTPVESPPAGS